jgi:hypoxanthine phosphoribosyltransferase
MNQSDRMRVVFSREEIDRRVRELGQEISERYRGKQLVVVCVLKGAFIFCADLVRVLSIDVEMDFVRLGSYGGGKSSLGKVLFKSDVEISIENKHVLIVEDIVDTGNSMSYLKEVFAARGPLSIAICALLDKKERREANVQVDFSGFHLEKGFAVGYGLDFAEKYRHLDSVLEILPE